MSIKEKQLRKLIREILDIIDLNSTNAVELLMLTAAQESHLGRYIEQVNGPAQGIFQMEPATEKDIWENFLKYRPDLSDKVKTLMFNISIDLNLRANLAYQIAMARIHYYRVKDALPDSISVINMAKYWKKYYNTIQGKGKVEEAVNNYNRFC